MFGSTSDQVNIPLAQIYPQKYLFRYIREDMQQKYGVSDCGLFAAALSTDLAFKANPSELILDQSRMRFHLTRCLSNQILSLFPTLYIGNEKVRGRRAMKIDLYCVCNMQESFSNYMTKWCECTQWFLN